MPTLRLAAILQIQRPSLLKADGTALADGVRLSTAVDPVTVKVGPVTRAGRAVGPGDLESFSLWVVRVQAAGGPEQAYDAQAKQWVTASTLAAARREYFPMEYKAGEAKPYQGPVFFVGPEGKWLEAEATGYPRHAVRAVFKVAGQSAAVSEPSPWLLLPPPPGKDLLAGMWVDNIQSPNWLKLFLKESPSSPLGQLIMEKDKSRITLVNKAGGRVVLEENSMTVTAGGVTMRLKEKDMDITPPADGHLTITVGTSTVSVQDGAVTIQGDSITLTAGGATLTMAGGNITMLTPAARTVLLNGVPFPRP
ncbi:MAG: hypothetical protein ACYC9Q_15080 [Bacillota bacterium]